MTSKRRRPQTPAPPLLDPRLLLLMTVSALLGLLVGLLAWRATKEPWAGTLAGLSTAGVTLGRLHDWTTR